MKDQCQEPVQNGKGYWTANDRRFGTGLNLPRTRHTSEILKTRVRTEPDQNTIYVPCLQTSAVPVICL